ncbi:hypothetical protein KDM41_06250 [bacterium]|nr:hypothetical protein [bacterium]
MSRGAWRRRRTALVPALGLLALCLGGGCGEGDSVPLLAPGGGREWPIDDRWIELPQTFGDGYLIDAAWDPGADVAARRVLLLANDKTVYLGENGAWTVETVPATMPLREVVAVGPDAFLARGDGGEAWLRRAGVWRREETGVADDLPVCDRQDAATWFGGPDGTLVRRDDEGWRTFAPPRAGVDIRGVAARGDTLFVAIAGSDSVWARVGETWTPLAPGPWAGTELRGLHVMPDGHLLVAATVVWGRTTAGWIDLGALSGYELDAVRFRSVPGRLFAEEFEGISRAQVWTTIAWSGGAPSSPERIGFAGVSARDATHWVTAEWRGRVRWWDGETWTADPGGRFPVSVVLAAGTDGLLVMTEAGIAFQEVGRRVAICNWSDFPGCSYATSTGAGRGPTDFWVVGAGGLFHVLHGAVTRVDAAPPSGTLQNAAVDGRGRLHVVTDRLWRWSDGWEPLLLADEGSLPSERVWPLGDGRLIYRGLDSEVRILGDEGGFTLGRINDPEHIFATATGRLAYLDRLDGDSGRQEWNLLLWDPQGGGFRNVGSHGLGALAGLFRISARGGARPLVWTDNPCLVLTLDGDPPASDWNLLAGPAPRSFYTVTILADGSLLALDGSRDSFHLYRP